MVFTANMISGMRKASVAFLFSATINMLIFIMLASLNDTEDSEKRRPPVAPPVLTPLQTSEPCQPKSPTPDTPRSTPEIMTVDLDRPVPKPALPTPIKLDLSMPEISGYTAPLIALRSPQDGTATPNTGTTEARGQSAFPRSANRVDEPPEELDNPPPNYPRAARIRGIEGSVTVKLLINERGVVENVRILRVEGHPSFRQAVLNVARKWRFRPARQGNRPVTVWAVKRIRFELED